MGSVEVVKALPFVQFDDEIDVAFIGEKLVELLTIRPVRTFAFSVQQGCAAFGVGMADTQILDVPVEFCLELMAVVSADFPNTEGELSRPAFL